MRQSQSEKKTPPKSQIPPKDKDKLIQDETSETGRVGNFVCRVVCTLLSAQLVAQLFAQLILMMNKL